jgi:hypothetical protein
MQDFTNLHKWKWFIMESFFSTTQRPGDVEFNTDSEFVKIAANGVRLGMILVMIMHCILLLIGACLFAVGVLVGTVVFILCSVGILFSIPFILHSFV